MTLNEKAYFRRYAKTHSGNEDKNYLKIYKVIEKTKKYDKYTLPNHFKGTTIEKYLSSEVKYLKEKLLISLFNYNMNRTIRNQIQKGILLVEGLAAKGFPKEALKKLKVVKKNALKQEEFTWVLRLIELEEMLIFKEGAIGYREKLAQLQEQRSKAISVIQNLNDYHMLRQEVRELQFGNQLIKDEIGDLEVIANNPLIATDENCLSVKAKEHWLYIQVLLHYLKRDFSKGLDCSSQYVEFMSLNIQLFDNTKSLPAVSNYIYHAALNSDKEHFEIGINLLTSIANDKEVSSFYVKYIQYSRTLEYAYYAKDVALMEEYFELSADLIDNDIAHYEESQIQYLLMLIVRSAIMLKQFDKGIHYSNLWNQRGVLSFRNIQARLFSIIIHYELKYTELLESEIVLLKKLEKKYIREKELIHSFYLFINSILKHPENINAAITTLQSSLKAIPKDNKEYFSFISFDYYSWSLTLE